MSFLYNADSVTVIVQFIIPLQKPNRYYSSIYCTIAETVSVLIIA